MTRVIQTVALLLALFVFSLPAAAQDPLGKRLSLDLKAMAPADAFKVIANAIGYTVDVAPDVATPVDIVVPNVTARTALATICDSIGCRWETSGMVIVVRKREPGGTLGASARAHGVEVKAKRDREAADRVADFKHRMNTTLPADMKFENAPMSVVADRLGKATGVDFNFVSEKTGQTLTADFGNQTLSAALKTLTEQYQGAVALTIRTKDGKVSRLMLHSGTAKRPIKPRK